MTITLWLLFGSVVATLAARVASKIAIRRLNALDLLALSICPSVAAENHPVTTTLCLISDYAPYSILVAVSAVFASFLIGA